MKTLSFVILLFLSPAIVFATLSATVTWDAPPADADVASHHLWRNMSTCAAFTGDGVKITTVPMPQVSYVDSTIPDGTTVVAYKVSAVTSSGVESTRSTCVEKTFTTTQPPPVDDHTAILAAIDMLKARTLALEGDVAVLNEQRDRLKAGWCALKGTSVTKDVLAERAALGGCP